MSAASKHRVYFLLQSTAHRLKKMADNLALDAGGMTTAQAAVLNIIIAEDGASQATIAKRLAQQESAITTMATRLQTAGYITKRRSNTDRRVWELRPTAEGRAALEAMMASLQEVNKTLDEALPKNQMNELAESLTTVLVALE